MRQTGSCHPVSCVREIDRGMRRERESCLGVGGLVDLKNMCHSYTPTAAADAAFNYKSSVAMPSSLYTPCFVLVFFFFWAVLYPICHTHCYISYPCARCVALLSVTSSLCSRVQCKQTSFAAICYVFLLWRLARAASSRFQTMHLETRP